jgi:Tat protein translocase TatB subunit
VFGIGGTELVIIAVVAFLFFGPDKLPEVARTVGKFMRQFKQIQDEVTSTIRSEMYEGPDLTNLPKLDGSDAKPAEATAAVASAPSTIGSGWETEDEEESEE